MKLVLLLLSLSLWSVVVGIDQFDIKEMLKRQQQEKEKNMANLPPNIVVFTFEDDKKHEMTHFSRILTEFMGTIGVTTTIVNTHNNDLIATIPTGKTFDKQIVLDNFKGIWKSVDIGDFAKNNNSGFGGLDL